MNPHSNRNDPRFVQYYQDLADIIRIFWEFHKIRMSREEVYFASISAEGNGQANPRARLPFHPQVEIESDGALGRKRKRDVIMDYSFAIELSLHTSWKQFLNIPNHQLPAEYDAITKNPYLLSLLDRASTVGSFISTVDRDSGTFSLQDIVERGITTGVDASNQLASIFGEAFTPLTALVISKVRIRNTRTILEGIGVALNTGSPSTHELLDPDSKTKLVMKELRELGYGDTLGCPASKRPSAECMAFLQKVLPAYGVKETKLEGTMLDEFAIYTAASYKKDIKDWYDRLSDEQRLEWIDSYTRARIEGKVSQSLEEGGTEAARCPWHRKE